MDFENNSFEADKRRFRMWAAGIITGLLLLAACCWFGSSAYRHFKEKHGQAEALAFLAKGDFRNAMLSARQTLLLNPTNVPACRVMAALADLARSPAALDWQRRIVQTEPTVENKLQLAAASLRYQSPPFLLAAQILDELAPAATNFAGYQAVAASMALSLHRLDEAETHFEIAARLDPTNKIYLLNLAIIRLGETNATKSAQSRDVLEKMRTDENLGLPALRALLADRLAHNDVAASNDFSTQALACAGATLEDKLQHLYILHRLKGADFAASLSSVQRQSATNAAMVSQTASWMEANGFWAETAGWLDTLPADVQAQPSVRIVRANYYLGTTNWQGLCQFAAKGDWGEIDFLRMAYLSRAWNELGEHIVADGDWNSAVSLAANQLGALNALLELAGRWEMKTEQEDLLWRIVRRFPDARWAQNDLELLCLSSGNTTGLYQLYSGQLSRSPHDALLKNNAATTALLLKTNLTEACRWAEEAYAQNPTNADIVSTYAFALHLQDRNNEGIAALEKLNPSQLDEPSVSLYYGLLLSASGKAVEAAPYLKTAQNLGRLLPEEKRLLAEALKAKPDSP